jgi:hypothetical protein
VHVGLFLGHVSFQGYLFLDINQRRSPKMNKVKINNVTWEWLYVRWRLVIGLVIYSPYVQMIRTFFWYSGFLS